MRIVITDWLSIKQVAAILGLNRATLHRYRRDNEGPPFYVIGEQIRYSKKELEDWIAGQRKP